MSAAELRHPDQLAETISSTFGYTSAARLSLNAIILRLINEGVFYSDLPRDDNWKSRLRSAPIHVFELPDKSGSEVSVAMPKDLPAGMSASLDQDFATTIEGY